MFKRLTYSLILFLSLPLFSWSQPTVLSCDEDLMGSISALGEIDQYSINGEAGQVIIVQMAGEGGVDAKLELWSPDGTLIDSDSVRTRGLARIGPLSLEKSGEYILTAQDAGGDETNDYGLSYQLLEVSCTREIGCSEDVAADLDLTAELDAYFFSGVAGEGVSIVMKGRNLGSSLELYFEDGSLIDQDIQSSSFRQAVIGPLTLPETGNYFILARDDRGDNQSEYGISFQSITAVCAVELNCADNITASMTEFAEQDAYYFEGQAGDRIVLRMVGENLSPKVVLFGPDGSSLAEDIGDNSFDDAQIGPFELPEDGAYVLIVSDKEADGRSEYGLSFQVFQPECVQLITCSDQINGQFLHLAQIDAYYFEGQAGDPVNIFMEDDGTVVSNIELFDSEGTLLRSSTEESSSPALINAYRLPEDGVYFILATSEDGDELGEYGISYTPLVLSCARELDCSATVTGSFQGRVDLELYYFSAEKGETVIIEGIDNFFIRPSIQLYASNGSLIATTSESIFGKGGRIGPVKVPENGNYFVLVRKRSRSNSFLNYQLHLQLLRTSCISELSCKVEKKYEFNQLGEFKVEYLPVKEGDRIIFRTQTPSFSFNDFFIEVVNRSGDYVLNETLESGETARFDISVSQNDTLFFILSDEDGEGDSDINIALQVLGGDCSTAIACGETVSASPFNRLQINSVLWSGKAGEKLLIQGGYDTRSTVHPRIEVYNNKGTLQAEHQVTESFIRLPFTVPEDGDYFILLMDDRGSSRRPFGLTVLCFDESCTTESITCNQTVSSVLEATYEARVYSFSAMAGEHIIARAYNESTADFRMDLYDEMGGFIASSGEVEFSDRLEADIPTEGIYFILFTNLSSADSEQMNLSLQSTNPTASQNCTTPINCGLNLSIELEFGSQMEGFTFEGQADDQIIFQGATLETDLQIMFELYGPDGQLITSGTDRLDMQLETTGLYTLLVMNASARRTGTIGFSFQNVNNHNCGTPIQYNTNRVYTTEHLAQLDAYTFDVSSSDIFVFRSTGLTNSFNPVIELYDLNGQLVTSRTGRFGAARLNPVLVLASGSLKVLVSGEDRQKKGGYGYSLQKVNPAVNAISLEKGMAREDTIFFGASMIAYTYRASAGEDISVRMETTELGFTVSPQIELYSPSGELLNRASGRTVALLSEVNLPESGVYTILAMDDDGADAGTYRIGVNLSTSTEGLSIDKGLTLSCQPNPVKEEGAFILELPSTARVALKVFAADGKPVLNILNQKLTAGAHQISFDASSLPAGAYFASMEMEGRILNTRFIVLP